jgi:phosphate starvation-inducible PhoH-like protein
MARRIRESFGPMEQSVGGDPIAVPGPRVAVKPRTDGQRRYVEALSKHPVVFGVGPAGTGKTFLAVAAAVAAVKAGDVRRIVLVRPAVEAGEKLGFLPGDFQAKVDPYLRPLYDALHDLLDPREYVRYMETELIEICPLAYMRGRTLNHAFVILDEAQNTTIPQMLMFLTRMGEGSRMVVTGDPSQVDLPGKVPSGLADALGRFVDVEGVAVVQLTALDVMRHEVVQRILAAYGRETTGA